MKHLVRSVSGFVLHFVLATVLYGWACAILHELASGKLTLARNRALLLCIAVALVAVFWFLSRRYHVVRRVVLFVLGLAALQSLVHLDSPWLTAFAGCLVFA